MPRIASYAPPIALALAGLIILVGCSGGKAPLNQAAPHTLPDIQPPAAANVPDPISPEQFYLQEVEALSERLNDEAVYALTQEDVALLEQQQLLDNPETKATLERLTQR